jgi:hypothetical protein
VHWDTALSEEQQPYAHAQGLAAATAAEHCLGSLALAGQLLGCIIICSWQVLQGLCFSPLCACAQQAHNISSLAGGSLLSTFEPAQLCMHMDQSSPCSG